MTRLARRLRRLGNVVWIFALLVCFGAMGLIELLPPVRRRGRERAARCATCRHHRIVWRIFVAGFLVLLHRPGQGSHQVGYLFRGAQTIEGVQRG